MYSKILKEGRHRLRAAKSWLPILAGSVLLAASARAQYDPDWASHFSIGGMVGLNIKASFQMGGRFDVASQPGVYDDGYVHPSQNVGGSTANFGYNSLSQYSAADNTLTMHRVTSFTSSGSNGQVDGGPMPGFELDYGANLWYWKRLRIGWDFGFGLLPISITASASVTGSANQSTFLFSTAGSTNFPTKLLPYHGSNGPNAAEVNSAATPGGSGTAPATITGSQKLDVIFYALRLGPSVYWDFNPSLGMSVSAGPAVGLVSGDLSFDEQVVTEGAPARVHGKSSGNDVVYGGYINTKLMYHVMHNGDLYIGAQFMPMSKADIGGGQTRARLDLTGAVYVSAGINWPF